MFAQYIISTLTDFVRIILKFKENINVSYMKRMQYLHPQVLISINISLKWMIWKLFAKKVLENKKIEKINILKIELKKKPPQISINVIDSEAEKCILSFATNVTLWGIFVLEIFKCFFKNLYFLPRNFTLNL